MPVIRGLANRIDHVRTTARANVVSNQGQMFLVVELAAGLLLILMSALVVLVSRKVMAPLTAIEQTLGHAANGDLDPQPGAERGWLTGAATEADRVRTRLREYRWAHRRDREALTQDGQTTLGLSAFLAHLDGAGHGVRADGSLIPAEGLMAGDFNGALPLPDGRTAVIQGDVSGHGVQAGLVAAMAKSRALVALRLGHSALEAVETAWTAIADQDERFLTLAVAVLDPRTGTVEWVNAGHTAAFLRRTGGTVERLTVTGPLLSSIVTPDLAPWDTYRTHLREGDVLVLTTDGLAEARNTHGHEFGEHRITESLTAMDTTHPADVIRTLHAAADRFGIDWQRDDTTIIAATFDKTPE
ncbi:PP2C family protein-serine/threonine phosphatase [Streptomyces sp. NPDC058486]|uniref:PP2C family protein-serine/threonine phosphatase n=1 Tax=unclassified Streptomyces TaxID=2593676 RepID=UPI00364EDF5C